MIYKYKCGHSITVMFLKSSVTSVGKNNVSNPYFYIINSLGMIHRRINITSNNLTWWGYRVISK